MKVYFECGVKRTFASAVDWPGWVRWGADEAEALRALVEAGPRYAAIVAREDLRLRLSRAGAVEVMERLPGTAMTDFGALNVPPAADAERTCDAQALERFDRVLTAVWNAFDGAVDAARGRRLRTGPRGGGRSLAGIISHVDGADEGHLRAVGWPLRDAPAGRGRQAWLRAAIRQALWAAGTGKLPAHGPRGGARWTARWLVRRVAWHAVTHTWEIERRVVHP